MKTVANELMNAFRPDSAIDEPDRFSGRRNQLLDLTQALHSPGSCLMIIGDRGLGKSSLAEQIRLIAMGESSLLDRNGLGEWAIPTDNSFVALYINCTDAIANTNDILRRLSIGVSSIVAREVAKSARFRLEEKATKSAVSLKIFSHERVKRWTPVLGGVDGTDTTADYDRR